MTRLRSLFVWLLMLALPLQGFAAATMLFCGPGAHRTLIQAQANVPHREANREAHDHATEGHQDATATKQNVDGEHGKLANAGHKGSTCSSYWNTVAIIESPRAIGMAALPQVEYLEPLVLILTAPSRVPEKPPRV